MRHVIFSYLIGIFVLTLGLALWLSGLWWLPLISGGLLCVGIYDSMQHRHSLLVNFPLIGRMRWIIEDFRPFFQQYLLETETSGRPISRMFRSIVYQRAKGSVDSVPFGTQVDTYKSGYEWIGHSLSALSVDEVDHNPRITIGGPDCKQPYSASILNVSAMSFGALSKNAVMALNKGAALGGFYQNTGEGGLTPYHLENGGDIVWQIGTGYFGCRTKDGNFNELAFQEKAALPAVKMIEIKLSQGAKPGHGGILPAHKNTPEIAEIRGVTAGEDVISPPTHKAFSTPVEMCHFIQKLRELSDGKPIGFKLALGRKSEFLAICKAMIETGITPDFITVDGGEGGTGAAPLEYSNSIGFPLREALAFIDDALVGFGVRDRIKLIASGKIITAFQVVKNLSLGADLCNSARGMMFAIGCVQSLSCNTNTCPTGVATQDPKLYKGLDVNHKSTRVATFHKKTILATVDILSSTGHGSTEQLNRTHIFRRVDQQTIMRYDELFPLIEPGSFINEETAPKRYQLHLKEACASTFKPANTLAEINHETQSV
ncbi:FMN-binding glutamate synthase family protein [Alteromonas lipolytica]|uniref:Glutamate synthase n=1 Tax=Alteromonas lipolytica TaxID=1856405 RepID=A0A1E8FH12_9ALTE|nr:FMN-binding glutamate synthase family protein [Alteromonas lipolytica]OFI35211.1 glutamate synthase [Alteromonas lipolytica]GGF57647.1 FMN-binding glutamate synthase family protein [Alteromonas lipolytica]